MFPACFNYVGLMVPRKPEHRQTSRYGLRGAALHRRRLTEICTMESQRGGFTTYVLPKSCLGPQVAAAGSTILRCKAVLYQATIPPRVFCTRCLMLVMLHGKLYMSITSVYLPISMTGYVLVSQRSNFCACPIIALSMTGLGFARPQPVVDLPWKERVLASIIVAKRSVQYTSIASIGLHQSTVEKLFMPSGELLPKARKKARFCILVERM